MIPGFGKYKGLTEWGPFEWPLSLENSNNNTVNIPSGLAVEFKPHGVTSYLNRVQGFPTLTQMIVSFWFRVPAASISACAANHNPNNPLNGVIPLLCWGPTGSTTPFIEHRKLVTAALTYTNLPIPPGTASLIPNPLQDYIFSLSAGKPVSTTMSWIGVNCFGPPSLAINLQTNQHANVSAAAYYVTQIVPSINYTGISQPGYPPTNPPFTQAKYTFTDYSSLVFSDTEVFTGSTNGVRVIPGRWHHVLLSFTLKNIATRSVFPLPISAGVTSAARMWLAFDDVNITQQALSDFWPDGSSDPNAILTSNAYLIASRAPNSGALIVVSGTDPSQVGIAAYHLPTGPQLFSLPSPSIPTGNAAAGIPATAPLSNHIYRVEMAEEQIFIGKTLDTSVVGNRRLFVDKKGSPVPPSVAIKKLGQPSYILHGTKNWQRGLPAFHPVGPIPRYKPDPSLHGPQGKP